LAQEDCARPRHMGIAGGALLWWLLAAYLPPAARLPVILVLILLTVAIGIPAATLEERGCGGHDPSHVVIDEVAGQLVTFIACPSCGKRCSPALYFFVRSIS